MTVGKRNRPMPDTGAARTTKPTLRTIAEISGLAVPTVSRALKDAPDIGKSTRERVRRIADEIGYVPNRAGVRLRTGKTNVISLVLSTDHDILHHTARLISSIAGRLRDTRYHLIMTPYFPDEDPMKPVRYIVETGSADAVILNQIEPEDARVAYLMERGFPFVTHGRTAWAGQHPYCDFDNEAYGRLAAEKLLSLGRHNLLLIAPPRHQAYAQHMIAGITEAAAIAGARFEVLDGATSDDTSELIEATMRSKLSDKPRIDGIICASATAAMASVGAAEALGLDVGRDFDLLAKQARPFLKLFRPAILTMPEDVANAGGFLADAAMAAVDRPEQPPMQKMEVPTADQIE